MDTVKGQLRVFHCCADPQRKLKINLLVSTAGIRTHYFSNMSFPRPVANLLNAL